MYGCFIFIKENKNFGAVNYLFRIGYLFIYISGRYIIIDFK